MKYNIVLMLALLGAGCTTQQYMKADLDEVPKITIYQNDKVGIASIISNKALDSFKDGYTKAPKNKAFAQSLSGAWNWKSDRASIEHATTSALIGCQRNNKRSEDLYPCKIIHVNDNWQNESVSEL